MAITELQAPKIHLEERDLRAQRAMETCQTSNKRLTAIWSRKQAMLIKLKSKFT